MEELFLQYVTAADASAWLQARRGRARALARVWAARQELEAVASALSVKPRPWPLLNLWRKACLDLAPMGCSDYFTLALQRWELQGDRWKKPSDLFPEFRINREAHDRRLRTSYLQQAKDGWTAKGFCWAATAASYFLDGETEAFFFGSNRLTDGILVWFMARRIEGSLWIPYEADALNLPARALWDRSSTSSSSSSTYWSWHSSDSEGADEAQAATRPE